MLAEQIRITNPMAKKKIREDIPPELAARVLFLSDRTCCVCRVRGKPVQIHHIDENPNNNALTNFAVLCFECHRDTQIRGGFDRKLDAEQVILYRDDWHRIIVQGRTLHETHLGTEEGNDYDLELATSLAEIYRENHQFQILAMHYNKIGNHELRDKYIELALQEDTHDQTICFLRCLQGKPELIPQEVVKREITRYTKYKDWLQRARFYRDMGRHREATSDYIRGINETLRKGNFFAAAFYLKEFMEKHLLEELFVLALQKAREEENLWWQVRALQELEWQKELDDLILSHAEEIEQSQDPALLMLLAEAKGDTSQYIELRKTSARNEYIVVAENE